MNFISRLLYGIYLDYKQKQVSKRYKQEGLTRKVLNEQAKINEMRHDLDLPDRYEMIYKRFVQ